MAGRVSAAAREAPALRGRGFVVAAGIAALFLCIAAQLVRLSLATQGEIRLAMAEPIARVFSRPDIVDRRGRLVATDVGTPSLYADPALMLDRDEVVEKLLAIFPDLDAADLRRTLDDRTRRFAWVKRGLTPVQAQRVHDLGLPGLAFRREPKRVYPAGALVGHLVGQVNVDNKGLSGLERHIDETMGMEVVVAAAQSRIATVHLSLDLGVQHAMALELREAQARYKASGAAGLVMDVKTGELIAAVSLPDVDPNRPAEALAVDRLDRLSASVFELGSIFKTLTVAMLLEEGVATLDKVYDVRQPLEIGPHTITDLHPQGRPLTVRDIFLHSSNVGAGMMALEAGQCAPDRFPVAAWPAGAGAHRGGTDIGAAAAQALGRDRDRHHRLRPRPCRRADPVRRRHRGSRQRRHSGGADLPRQIQCEPVVRASRQL